jgi:hypothetical protein
MWIAVNSGLLTNKKLMLYAARAGISRQEAAGRLVELWTLAQQNAGRDGTLRGVDAQILAMMLNLQGEAAKTHISALLAAGLLEHHADGLAIHDWEEYQAPWYDYQDKRKRDRQRYRQKKAGEGR